uniref:Tryptophan synthase alpha chain n=1 Tax=Gracilariopsis mclachlanii TaxID=486813 RepID=A0A345U9Z5_9FLOR|nr:tryptophan synthase alpha subunit [Gracilariopsis mclachlanii]AXI97281.1 tryptophan synthase alpha subunit [Gracilariopsis mclachlanii]
MNVITEVLRNKGSNCALVPFITAGYPNLPLSIKALRILDKEGADIIELGIPYSDALADGPIIQHASKVALEQGIYIEEVLYILSRTTSELNAPIVIFTYYNPILVRGISRFIEEISKAGAKGLIIPDLPLEEVDYIIKICSLFSIELILFIAPTSSPTRIKSILSKSPGCIYLVSSCGVTGIRNNIDLKIQELAEDIKRRTDKFVILGFGINNPYQITKILNWPIDGIVIGSAVINHMIGDLPEDILKSLACFCQKIKQAM